MGFTKTACPVLALLFSTPEETVKQTAFQRSADKHVVAGSSPPILYRHT
jgi:hypothetical protein